MLGVRRATVDQVTNPEATVLDGYRPRFRALAADLGRPPSPAGRIDRPAGAGVGSDDDSFD
jgi:hypothetical protein